MKLTSLVGIRLREERVRRGLSQGDAGKIVDVSREMWGKYERGAMPGGEVFLALVQAGFDVLYILTGQRTPKAVLTPEEDKLIRLFHLASPEGQAAALAMLAALNNSNTTSTRQVFNGVVGTVVENNTGNIHSKVENKSASDK